MLQRKFHDTYMITQNYLKRGFIYDQKKKYISFGFISNFDKKKFLVK